MKIVVDTDIGVDDAQVLDLLFASKDIELLAITLVAGNASMPLISENCRKIQSYLGHEEIPVYESGSHNLHGNFIKSDGYFGANALANIELPPHGITKRQDLSSPQALIHYVRKYPHEVTILCIGPLTNVAMAFLMDTEFPSLVGHIIAVGCDVNVRTLKNVTDFAEFNVWCDPLAYHIINKCFTSLSKPITLVDWHAMCVFLFDYSTFEALTQHKQTKSQYSKYSEFFLMFSDKTNEILAKNHWSGGFLCGDLVGAMVLHSPEIVLQKRRVSIGVTLSGKQVGHTVMVDDQAGVFELVTDLDIAKMSQNLVQILTGAQHPDTAKVSQTMEQTPTKA